MKKGKQFSPHVETGKDFGDNRNFTLMNSDLLPGLAIHQEISTELGTLIHPHADPTHGSTGTGVGVRFLI